MIYISKIEKYNHFFEYINEVETGNGCKLLTPKNVFLELVKFKKPTAVKLKIQCSCGEKFERSFTGFKKSTKTCFKCSDIQRNKSKTKTKEEFLNDVYNLVGDEFDVLEDYISARKKIKFRHNSKSCDFYEFYKTPANFLSGQRCPMCNAQQKTHEDFVQDVFDVYGNEYTVLSEYISPSKKVLVQHNSENCRNHKWEVSPTNFPKYSGCPKCQCSKGEKKIEQFLIDNKIKYKQQYSFQDCKHKRTLKFDFAIFDASDSLILIIEYDGEYHFKKTRHKDSEKILQEQKNRDYIKNEYCENKNIKLVRIPYWKFDNIEEILLDVFNRVQ